MQKKLRVGVLASGGGTDFQSIIDASEKKMINAEVVVLICDKSDAYCMKRADKHSIDCFYLETKGKAREEIDEETDSIMEDHDVDLIVGAGYMRILTGAFVTKWYGKIINIHPALLPSFKGVNGQGDALAYGVKLAGCTTHFMDEKMDSGPIILQAAVKVLPDDDRDSLAYRILEVEHQILPRTINLFEKGCLEIKGRVVEIKKDKSWKEKYKVLPDVLYSEGY